MTCLEVYSFVFNITEEINKFVLYTDTFDEFYFVQLEDEFEEILSISDFKPSHLQHETRRPQIIKAYHKFGSEKSSTDGYVILLMGYARSPFSDFIIS